MPTNEELQQQIDELRERLEDRREIEEIKQLLINHQHDGIDTFNFSKLKRSEKKGLVGGSTTTLHKHDIVEDTTPQLGGDLDLNGHSIDFPSTANISDVKDEDDMASNSDTMLATQQSIKKYVDDSIPTIQFYDEHADYRVYNGDAPTSWTELDLSPWVGSNYALIFLSIDNQDPSAGFYQFRMGTESDDVGMNASGYDKASGSTEVTIASGLVHYVILMTDESGKIDWRCDDNTINTTIYLRGFIKT